MIEPIRGIDKNGKVSLQLSKHVGGKNDEEAGSIVGTVRAKLY